jgi:hypothetical protein
MTSDPSTPNVGQVRSDMSNPAIPSTPNTSRTSSERIICSEDREIVLAGFAPLFVALIERLAFQQSFYIWVNLKKIFPPLELTISVYFFP